MVRNGFFSVVDEFGFENLTLDGSRTEDVVLRSHPIYDLLQDNFLLASGG